MSGMYDVTLAPGVSGKIPAVGVRAKVLSAPQGAVSVRLDGGEAFSLMEGQGVKKIDGKDFSFVEVRNLASTAQTVIVFIGDDSFEDSRVTGVVRIIDSSADKTLAGNQFLQSNTLAGTVGAGSVIALHPNASAKRITVRSLFLQSGVAGTILLAWGTGGGTLALGTGGVQLKSKLLNATGSESRSTSGVPAAASPVVGEVTGLTSIARFYVPALDTRQIKFDNPIIVTGTNILVVSAEALNRDLSVVWDVEELV